MSEANATPRPKPISVLLVDDDEALRSVVRRLLEQAGLHVAEASSGEDAWRKLFAGFLPSVVVVDLSMPDEDGVQLIYEMRAHRLFRHLPVIVYSTDDFLDRAEVPWVLFADKSDAHDKLIEQIKKFAR